MSEDQNTKATSSKQKDFMTAAMLSWLLGVFGIDRFYLGYVGLGLGKLFTFGGLGLWAFIDLILILAGSTKSKDGQDLKGRDKNLKFALIIIGVFYAVSILFMVFAGGNTTTDTNNNNSSSDTSTTAPTEPEATPKPDFAFDDGMHIIGTDIAAGTYRTYGDDTGYTGCYWARLAGFSGELDDIIANNADSGKGSNVVTIAASDKGFETQGCGKWYKELKQVTDSKTSFSDGTFIIGTDITPATYRNSGSDDSYGCYWARLSGFSGELKDIIANNVGDAVSVVTIAAGDKGFSSSGCGTWEKL